MTEHGLAVSRRAFLTLSLLAPGALALGRRPYGGVLRLELPMAISEIDPFDGGDLTSALFAPAITDSLYAWDNQGRPYPTLAESRPVSVSGGLLVTLRPGLITARGKTLDARDVIASIERARSGVARALLAPFPTPRRQEGHPLTVRFDGADPDALADVLASPCMAIVPRGASSRAPDGTGAFRAAPTRDQLVLERNERAARGPSYLDRIEVRAAPDLASALRSFESGDTDVGFLGAGLHRRRAGAVDFRTETVGSVVLRSGSEAHGWGAPGVTSSLVAGIDPARLATLGLTTTARGTASPDAVGWGGAPSDVLVDAAAPYLAEVARVVAETLSRPGHEIRPLPLPRTELRTRLASGKFALAVEFVRKIGGTERHALLALLATLDPQLADKPPDSRVPVATVLRTLPAAVIGELAIVGAHVDDVEGLERWDLGAITRGPKRA